MKYTIEAIENAKPGMRWEEIGCHWTLGQAYLYSKEAGNDLAELRRSHLGLRHRSNRSKTCRKLTAVKEFTISSTFSSLHRDHCKAFEELGMHAWTGIATG